MSVMDGVNRLTKLVGRNRLELLLFHLGSKQRFGINVFKVREVIKCPRLTRVPHSHPVVRGVANMRGMTITVMDLGAAVGRPPIDMSRDNAVIVTEYNRKVQGFLVSDVERIVNMNWGDIKPPPKGMGQQNYLTAVTNLDDELVEIIDVEKVLADVIGMNVQLSDELTDDELRLALGAHHALVVDDSIVARKQVTGVLDQLGISYTSAENGRQAFDMLLAMAGDDGVKITDQVSIILSDVEMPEMDGYTLTKQIKEHPDLQDLYVCLHTSLSGNFNEAMIKRVGADRLISKFDPDDLAKVVLAHIKTIERPQAA